MHATAAARRRRRRRRPLQRADEPAHRRRAGERDGVDRAVAQRGAERRRASRRARTVRYASTRSTAPALRPRAPPRARRARCRRAGTARGRSPRERRAERLGLVDRAASGRVRGPSTPRTRSAVPSPTPPTRGAQLRRRRIRFARTPTRRPARQRDPVEPSRRRSASAPSSAADRTGADPDRRARPASRRAPRLEERRPARRPARAGRVTRTVRPASGPVIGPRSSVRGSRAAPRGTGASPARRRAASGGRGAVGLGPTSVRSRPGRITTAIERERPRRARRPALRAAGRSRRPAAAITARSASNAARDGGWSSCLTDLAACARPSARTCTASAPCPGAGTISSGVERRRVRRRDPQACEARGRQHHGVHRRRPPACRSRVSTFPRRSTIADVGPQPQRAARGGGRSTSRPRAAGEPARRPASPARRTDPRARGRPRPRRPPGSSAGRSFAECTARSIPAVAERGDDLADEQPLHARAPRRTRRGPGRHGRPTSPSAPARRRPRRTRQQRRSDPRRLGQGELRPPRAEPKRCHGRQGPGRYSRPNRSASARACEVAGRGPVTSLTRTIGSCRSFATIAAGQRLDRLALRRRSDRASRAAALASSAAADPLATRPQRLDQRREPGGLPPGGEPRDLLGHDRRTGLDGRRARGPRRCRRGQVVDVGDRTAPGRSPTAGSTSRGTARSRTNIGRAAGPVHGRVRRRRPAARTTMPGRARCTPPPRPRPPARAPSAWSPCASAAVALGERRGPLGRSDSRSGPLDAPVPQDPRPRAPPSAPAPTTAAARPADAPEVPLGQVQPGRDHRLRGRTDRRLGPNAPARANRGAEQRRPAPARSRLRPAPARTAARTCDRICGSPSTIESIPAATREQVLSRLVLVVGVQRLGERPRGRSRRSRTGTASEPGTRRGSSTTSAYTSTRLQVERITPSDDAIQVEQRPVRLRQLARRRRPAAPAARRAPRRARRPARGRPSAAPPARRAPVESACGHRGAKPT